jgi:hypothetical protein
MIFLTLNFDPSTGKLTGSSSGGSNLSTGSGIRSSAASSFRRFWKSGLIGLICLVIGNAGPDLELFIVATVVLWIIAAFFLIKAIWLWIFD